MASISLPLVNSKITRPQAKVGPEDQRVLILGYLDTPNASATAGDLYQDIQNDESWKALFGPRAELSNMITGFKDNNAVTKLDVICAAPPDSGSRGSADVTFTGTATENGEIELKIGSGIKNKYTISVLNGDTAAVIATALTTAMTNDTDAPFVVSDALGVTTIEATNLGGHANQYHISFSGAVAGITTVVTAFTGGVGTPTLTGVFDPVEQLRYQNIVWPGDWDIATAKTFITDRFNVDNDLLDGVVLSTYADTVANVKASVSAINEKLICINSVNILNEATKKGCAVPELPDVLAAKVGAARALRLTEGADTSGILTSQAPGDIVGGASLNTLPLHNTLIKNVDLGLIQDQYSKEEQVELSNSGVSVLGLNQAGNGIILGTQVTTELTDPAGNPDETFKFQESIDTALAVREYFFLNLKKKYAQSRLTNGDLNPRYASANESSVRVYMIELYNDLAQLQLLQGGNDQRKQFNETMIISVDVQSGLITIDCKPPQVGQVRLIVNTNEVNFGE